MSTGTGMRVIAARDIPPAQVPGHSFRIVADGASTGGAFSLTEATSPAGATVGPHAHDTAVECFYVAEGSYLITVSGTKHEITPGGFALVPRGAPHQFEVTGDQAGRAVVMFAPAGFESVFGKMPEIFGTPGEPGPLWQRLNEDFATRLLPESHSTRGPAALVSPGGCDTTVLAGPAATSTGLTIGLRSDPRPGSAWILPSPVSAVWIVSGGYRFEAPAGAAEAGEGEYLWLHEAAPRRATSLRPDSQALYLLSDDETRGGRQHDV